MHNKIFFLIMYYIHLLLIVFFLVKKKKKQNQVDIEKTDDVEIPIVEQDEGSESDDSNDEDQVENGK